MFQNYLKIALRNLVKHKTFSLINILGLTGGLTCCLLIFVFVSDELSYDNFHSKKDRIYRVEYFIGDFDIARIPPVFAEHFDGFFPEIEKTARMFPRNISVLIDQGIGIEPKKFEEEGVWFADSSTFEIFDYNFVHGSIKNALHDPFTVLLNEEIAEKYFGTIQVIGKKISMEGKSFKIAGVVKDFPNNSHFHFNILAPYQNMLDVEPEPLGSGLRRNFKRNYMVSHSFTYVLLEEGANPESVEERFVDFVNNKIPEPMRKGQSFKLQPLHDIHLNSDVGAQSEPPGNLTFLYIFIAVGALTLIIACINFINLSTARSLQRTKEIGMRKVMGAWKTSLVNQFLGESFVTTAFASILAFIATVFLLPVLNEMTGKELEVAVLYTPWVWLGFILLFILTSIMAGLYPAFFVTKISPVYTLKGLSSTNAKGGLSFRKGLIVVQFTISIILISGTLVVREQLDLLRNKPLGFKKDLMVNVPVQSQNFNNVFGGVSDEKRTRLNSFEEAMASIPGVEGSTISANAPGQGVVNRNAIPEGFTAEDNILAPVFAVDYDFLEVYEIEILSGRNFSKEFSSDPEEAFIINEKAIEEYQFGSLEEAIGKSINIEGKEGKVIGVIENFNFMPLTQPIGALIMDISIPQFNTFSIKLHNLNVPETLSEIENLWNTHFPNETFDHTFLDEQINQIYATQEQLGKVVSNFSILAILISCLGSYGLIMFVASQKMKEIGIRKVLGASVAGLVLMLSKRFIWLTLIAMVIAVPISYWLADWWLEDFSYRISISPFSFLLGSAITIALVFFTIGFRAFRTANANPVNALRNE
ncbi:MAG: ABC transporter permease [Reichenbachiella sp.]